MATDEDFTGPVNLGNPKEFTIRQVADKVVALTGSRSKITHQPLPIDDPKQRQPDIGLAMAKLAWTPSVQIDQGLNQTIAYFDKLLTDAPKRLRLVTQQN
jgi:UDP-glucuronate decarboxylase